MIRKPNIKPLEIIETPTTGNAARAQMLADARVTNENVFAAMGLSDAQRAELMPAFEQITAMLIGGLSDEDALETFKEAI